MWTRFYLLLLMLFTLDLHRDKAIKAERIQKNVEAVSLDHDQSPRTETRSQPEGWGEKTEILVGKWRNNGEALEPIWRDGDSIPLLPFSQISRFSEGKGDNAEAEVLYRQARKYQEVNGPENSVRSRNNLRLSHENYEDYELIESSGSYREREEASPRKENGPTTDHNTATVEKASNLKDERSKDFNEHKDRTLNRESFQVRPNNYEYDFSDEEYLKPKPRKRRPPQNYEFNLSESEGSLNRKKDDNDSRSESNNEKTGAESAKKKNQPIQNATELKSLLKMQQEEGLSLSEILQRKNLTLNDLLKGRADAINALKMKDIEENEYYGDGATRTLPGSFAMLSTSTKPRWTTAAETTEEKNSQKNDELVVPIILAKPASSKNHTSAKESSSSNDEMHRNVESAMTGKSILTRVDPAQSKVIIATSMPVVIDSMELLQADEAATKSPSNSGIKAENLDEDEIMEFSDFTDYKKGRSGISPVWLMMKDGQINIDLSMDKSKGHIEDKSSTLSIEKILSPTERSESEKNSSISSGVGEGNRNKTKELIDENKKRISEHFEDYTTSFEKEYQDDAPKMHYNLEQSAQAKNTTSESGIKQSMVGETKSALDAMLYDANFTAEKRQPISKKIMMDSLDNNTLKNHENINKTEKSSYDDLVSQAEPEARAEIFELFASGSAGKRLERLLKSRNMSLEELIALRQRGSSKVHLADVSRIKAKKSNNENMNNLKESTAAPKGELDPSLPKTTATHDDLNDSGLGNYLSQSTESIKNGDSSFGEIVQSEESATEQSPTTLESEIANENLETRAEVERNKNHRRVEIVDLLTTFGSLPIARDMQRDIVGDFNEEQQRKLPAVNTNIGVIFINRNAEAIKINDTSDVMQSVYVEEVIKQNPSFTNIQTEFNNLGNDATNTDKGKTLSKIKPSIIASCAILGVTLVVFLAIFIVCKIQQRQKYRYRNTFSRAVFQGPVMAARKLSNSSSLSNVMVNVVATSTAKRPEKSEIQERAIDMESKSDIDNDSLDANDSWETIPDYMK